MRRPSKSARQDRFERLERNSMGERKYPLKESGLQGMREAKALKRATHRTRLKERTRWRIASRYLLT
jgi:hypothetical protein